MNPNIFDIPIASEVMFYLGPALTFLVFVSLCFVVFGIFLAVFIAIGAPIAYFCFIDFKDPLVYEKWGVGGRSPTIPSSTITPVPVVSHKANNFSSQKKNR